MARLGRRLTIGGSGMGSDEDSLAVTGARGEVRRFAPISEAEQIAQSEKIAQKSTEGAGPGGNISTPVLIVPDTSAPSGDAASDTGAAPGEASTEGVGPDSSTSGGPPAGDAPGVGGPGPGDTGGMRRGGLIYAKGGRIGGSQSEHPITAQAGEYILRKEAVAKYGPKLLDLLNAGKVQAMTPQDVGQHFSKGGMILGHGGRFAALTSKLEAKGESAHEAKAVAAIAGRRKYGGVKMAEMAAAGRRRHAGG